MKSKGLGMAEGRVVGYGGRRGELGFLGLSKICSSVFWDYRAEIPRLKSGASCLSISAFRAREGTPVRLKSEDPLPADRADQQVSRGAWGGSEGGKGLLFREFL